MSERVLVTGGAGFIGSHLVDGLLRRGDTVRVLDSLVEQAHPTGQARFVSSEAELVVGDLRDRATADRALDGIEVVYHQAAFVGSERSIFELRPYADMNVVATATLLEAIAQRRAQMRAIVLGSSMTVYGDGTYHCQEHGLLWRTLRTEKRLEARQWEPICPACGSEVSAVPTTEDRPLLPTSAYGITKRDQEDLFLLVGRTCRIPTVALRYSATYGPRQSLGSPYTGVAAVTSSRLRGDRTPILLEDGQQRRDFIHVSDVVRANLAAADADERAWYQSFNVGTGSPVTLLDVVHALAKALGKETVPNVTGEHHDGDARHLFPDVSRAKSLLDWEAKVSFAEGATELAAWAFD